MELVELLVAFLENHWRLNHKLLVDLISYL